MFFGWAEQHGGAWRGDYLVVDLREVRATRGESPSRLHFQRTKEVMIDDENGITFPMKAIMPHACEGWLATGVGGEEDVIAEKRCPS